MDDITRRFLQRLVRRIPGQLLKTTMEKWDRFTPEHRQAMDYTQSKWAFTEKLISICEENEWTIKHLSELEMIYVIDNPNQGMWHTLHLVDPEDDADSVELTQFKQQFRAHLSELVKNVSIKIKKHTDEAVWIRIAWGDGFSRPNHLKPTYVVHHLQTPYVFVSSMTAKQKTMLTQALVLSTRHHGIKDANLSGRKLSGIRDLLMGQYQQVFPSKYPSSLDENIEPVSNPRIEREQAAAAKNRRQIACEAFGGGALPQLQSAVYKLETKFKDHANRTMTERDESFKCVIKFESINLLESLRSCAASGIASTPVTPLLSSIPLKGRNYFVITDNGPCPASQTSHHRPDA